MFWLVVATLAGAGLLRLYALGTWPYAGIGWIALVPWVLAWRRCDSVCPLVAACFAGTALFTLLALHWFVVAVAEYTGWGYLISGALLSASSVLVQPQFLVLALACYAYPRLNQGHGRCDWASGLFCAAAYTVCDWCAPTKLLGDTLGLGLWPVLQWSQAADLGGVYLLTFFLVCVNVWVANALEALSGSASSARGMLSIGLAGTTVLALGLYGQARLRHLHDASGEVPARAAVRVGVIQGNLSHYDRMRSEYGTFGAVRKILDRYFELSASLGTNADFWVWPETVYPTTFSRPKSNDGALFDREIAAFVQFHQRPLVFGAYDHDADGEYNAAFFLLPDPDRGLVTKVQRKLYPFLFTEYVPNWLDSVWLRQHLPWLGTWKRGSAVDVVEMASPAGAKARTATLICYDAVSPGPARAAVQKGANLLLVLSNDSWFESDAGKRWALIASAFRSIETRRPQVRVTPTGFTAVIGETGQARLLVPPGQAAATVVDVPLAAEGTTLFVRWGDWLPWSCVVGMLLFGLWRGGRCIVAQRSRA